MTEIPKHQRKIILNELFVKSLPIEVEIHIDGQKPIKGFVKNSDDSIIEIEESGQISCINIKLIEKLFLNQ